MVYSFSFLWSSICVLLCLHHACFQACVIYIYIYLSNKLWQDTVRQILQIVSKISALSLWIISRSYIRRNEFRRSVVAKSNTANERWRNLVYTLLYLFRFSFHMWQFSDFAPKPNCFFLWKMAACSRGWLAKWIWILISYWYREQLFSDSLSTAFLLIAVYCLLVII